MKNYICHCIKSCLSVLILICMSFLLGCAKSNAQWSVYSVEILFNEENTQDFCALVGEQFNVSISVNNYEENYKFKIFYAWIDCEDRRIELSYSDNSISLDKAGHYKVKVMIIDLIGRLFTKNMPFKIMDYTDNESPIIIGDIADITKLYAYPNIGLILPSFEIIDNIDGKIEPEIKCVYGVIDYYATHNTWVYINKSNNNDQITIKGQDAKGNEVIRVIDVKICKLDESVYKWINPTLMSENDTVAIIAQNALLYKGNELFQIKYLLNIVDNINFYIGLENISSNTNSVLNIKYEVDSKEKYLIKIDFYQKIIIFNETKNLNFDSIDNLIININYKTISIKDNNEHDLYVFNAGHKVVAIAFELKDINIYVEALEML